MSDFHEEYTKLIDDVRVLVKKHARGRPPSIALSEETAALLDSLETAPAVDAPSPAPTPAASVPPRVEETAAPRVEEQHRPEEEVKEMTSPVDLSSFSTLDAIAEEVKVCTRCHLHETRSNAVPGEGSIKAPLVFVGEAPGASEDAQGLPFVGRSGNLLTDIIEKGMKLSRKEVFICNVVKCRPPANRAPSPDEVHICEPFLLRQLEILKPQVICALGAVAAQTLLKTTDPIFKLRGVWHDYHGIPCRVTYHPAYLLRNPVDKKKAWEDIQEIMKLMEEKGTVFPSS